MLRLKKNIVNLTKGSPFKPEDIHKIKLMFSTLVSKFEAKLMLLKPIQLQMFASHENKSYGAV